MGGILTLVNAGFLDGYDKLEFKILKINGPSPGLWQLDRVGSSTITSKEDPKRFSRLKEIPSLSQGKPGENRGHKTRGTSVQCHVSQLPRVSRLTGSERCVWKERKTYTTDWFIPLKPVRRIRKFANWPFFLVPFFLVPGPVYGCEAQKFESEIEVR